mmetsp:Transcript_58877/g.140462  ORF Transcript_58877/g.140462 Transcript_58877/m.140462 type:complete len:1393 (+) Transcript_58877:125-4303(+)
MPKEKLGNKGLLAQFDALSREDDGARAHAALRMREILSDPSLEGAKEERDYSILRLIRGLSSSRRCCRLGFSLALSELLLQFPDCFRDVLQFIRTELSLSSSLRPGEQKERLMGQLFGYAAALQAGSFGSDRCLASLDLSKNPFLELGQRLLKAFSARSAGQSMTCQILVDVCQQLCRAGQQAQVAELVSPWKLDEKVSEEQMDAYGAALVIELRRLHEDQVLAGVKKDEMRIWPACTRKDHFGKASVGLASALASAVATVLSQAYVGDQMWLLPPFCAWWLSWSAQQESGQRKKVCKAFETALLAEGAARIAQSLYGFGQFVAGVGNARSHPIVSRSPLEAEVLDGILMTLFTCMPKIFNALFDAVAQPNHKAYPAAVYAQQSLLNLLGAGSLPAAPQKGRAAEAHKAAETAPRIAPWPLSDTMRLAVISEVQKYKSYSAMRTTYLHQWEQALLMPLSAAGVRSHCGTLMTDFSKLLADGCGSAQFAAVKAGIDRLDKLSTRARSPDDVTLAVVCMLFGLSYFEPVDAVGGSTPFQDFRKAAKIVDPPDGGLDIEIPVVKVLGKGKDVEQFRGKLEQTFWATVSGLLKRSPNYAEAPADGAGASDERPDNATTEVSTVFKTCAYHGRLADQSLWIMRLHEWWNHLQLCGSADQEGNAAARPAKKRKKNEKAQSSDTGSFKCVVELSEDDLSLRQQCLEVCRSILAQDKTTSVLRQPRQRNAFCTFPLCLAMGLLASPSEHDADMMRENLQEIIRLGKVIAKAKPIEASSDARERLAHVPADAKEALAAAVRISAEVYGDSTGFVSQAALTLWRELGDFASDETLTSLSDFASGTAEEEEEQAENEDDDEDDDEDEDEDEDGDAAAAAASTTAKAEPKVDAEEDEADEDDDEEAGKADSAESAAAKAAEATSKKSKNDGEDDDSDDDGDFETLQGDSLLSELLGDDNVAGAAANPLLRSFAGEALNSKGVLKPKVSKRQQRARRLHEQISRQVRELELLDLFMQRFADKRPVSAELLQKIFAAMLQVSRPQRGGKKGKEKPGRSDNAVRLIQQEFSKNCGKALLKAMKRMSRKEGLELVSSWQSAAKWEEVVRAHFALASKAGSEAFATTTYAASVGGQMLYWFCAAHTVASLREGSGEVSKLTMMNTASDLTKEILQQCVQEWSTEKGKAQFCQAALVAFATRSPGPLLDLQWIDSIRSGRNLFTKRTQVTFLTSYVLRPWENMSEADKQRLSRFAQALASLCAELLEASVDEEQSKKEAASASAQNQKFRRDVLKGLSKLLRHDGKQWPRAINTTKLRNRISQAVAKVVDALPVKRHTVYQLCLQLQRSLKKAASDVKGEPSPGLRPQKSPSLGPRLSPKRGPESSPVLAPGSSPSAGPKKKRARLQTSA